MNHSLEICGKLRTWRDEPLIGFEKGFGFLMYGYRCQYCQGTVRSKKVRPFSHKLYPIFAVTEPSGSVLGSDGGESFPDSRFEGF